MQSTTFLLNDASEDKKSQSIATSNSDLGCHISPLVIMSIMNHYQRRPGKKSGPYPSFVIGILFGRKDKDNSIITITDSFGLEIQGSQNSNVALDLIKAKKAIELHATAHPQHRFVGWYRTGLALDLTCISIHRDIMVAQLAATANKLCKKSGGPELDESEYIHLLVDTALTNNRFSVRAYTTMAVRDPLQEAKYQDYLKEKKRRERLKLKGTVFDKPVKQRKRRRGKKAEPTEEEAAAQASQSQAQAAPNANATATANTNSTAASTEDNSATQTPKQPQQQPAPPQAERVEKVEAELKEVEKPLPIVHRFSQVPATYAAAESERIGLDMIIESPPEGSALDSPSQLMNDTNHLENVLTLLLQNLEQVENYVQMVISGQLDGNVSLGWMIGEALSAVPHLTPQQFEQVMSDRLQDFLMLVYLGKMTKAQLSIADKINKVLPSTVPGFDAEQFKSQDVDVKK